MNPIQLTSRLPSLGLTNQPAVPPSLEAANDTEGSAVVNAQKTKEAFTQFVGETFYAQMLKSMRATVGEPAYFHGGHAERQFQARLDQQLAQELATDGGGGAANELFESAFPEEAALLKESHPLDDLDRLTRR